MSTEGWVAFTLVVMSVHPSGMTMEYALPRSRAPSCGGDVTDTEGVVGFVARGVVGAGLVLMGEVAGLVVSPSSARSFELLQADSRGRSSTTTAPALTRRVVIGSG
jgi:hypothetical protein